MWFGAFVRHNHTNSSYIGQIVQINDLSGSYMFRGRIYGIIIRDSGKDTLILEDDSTKGNEKPKTTIHATGYHWRYIITRKYCEPHFNDQNRIRDHDEIAIIKSGSALPSKVVLRTRLGIDTISE